MNPTQKPAALSRPVVFFSAWCQSEHFLPRYKSVIDPKVTELLFRGKAVEHGDSPVERVPVALVVHRHEVHHQHIVCYRVQSVQSRLESREHSSAKNGMSCEIRASHSGADKCRSVVECVVDCFRTFRRIFLRSYSGSSSLSWAAWTGRKRQYDPPKHREALNFQVCCIA